MARAFIETPIEGYAIGGAIGSDALLFSEVIESLSAEPDQDGVLAILAAGLTDEARSILRRIVALGDA